MDERTIFVPNKYISVLTEYLCSKVIRFQVQDCLNMKMVTFSVPSYRMERVMKEIEDIFSSVIAAGPVA